MPYTKVLRDGILKVGKTVAAKVTNEEPERWFDLIGEYPAASLLKLYSQVSEKLSPIAYKNLSHFFSPLPL